MIEQQDIICISSVDWEPLWTRKQQVMSRLPHSNRILYVEPPISFLSPYKDPGVAFKKDLARVGVRQHGDNLWLLSPPVILPFGSRYYGINSINQRIIAHSVRQAIAELGFKDPILWTYLHTSADLVGKLGEKLVVYDCVDDHGAYEGFNASLVRSMEQRLLKQCDLVFCTARGLYEDKKPYCREIYLSPNAANVEHFSQADLAETPVAADIASLPRPILGFVGAIKEWIDLDLLAAAARAYPQGSLVMVGPVGANMDMSILTSLPNVHLLGHRDREVLPQYLKGFDVCLNPFKENQLTSTVSPLKFYEYLASGRPVASIPMPEISEFAGVIEFGQGSAGFVEAVNRALNDTVEKKAERRQLAAANSWESRVEFMSDKIGRHL